MKLGKAGCQLSFTGQTAFSSQVVCGGYEWDRLRIAEVAKVECCGGRE